METAFKARNSISTYFINVLAIVSIFVFFSSCVDDPVKEDSPELITKVVLTFTPTGGGFVVEAIATDPDGEGVQDLETDGPINLLPNQAYILSLSFYNELADATSPQYNVTNEVEEEGSEHMIFYSWTDGVFSSPSGNGNIDNRSDTVNYEDADSNGLPIGITTSWTTPANSFSGTFRIVLKHQPELKSNSANVDIGETDLDVTFDIQIQ